MILPLEITHTILDKLFTIECKCLFIFYTVIEILRYPVAPLHHRQPTSICNEKGSQLSCTSWRQRQFVGRPAQQESTSSSAYGEIFERFTAFAKD